MKKVAGRLRLELSQYRELEAFAQFGSDLDAETQAALGRGERLVEALNQDELKPWRVEDEVAAIYSGTGGYLDRIKVERVSEFHEMMLAELHSSSDELMRKIAGRRVGRRASSSSSATRSTRPSTTSARTSTKRASRSRRASRSVDSRATSRRSDEASVDERRESSRRAPSQPRRRTRRPTSMASQKDIKSRISSVKNIQKITRAMEMVSAARLRRAEQRIEQLRPYAEAIRKMTRRAAEAAENIPSLPMLQERETDQARSASC